MSDFQQILVKLVESKVIQQFNVAGYKTLLETSWPSISHRIVDLIKKSKSKDIINFRKTYASPIKNGNILIIFFL